MRTSFPHVVPGSAVTVFGRGELGFLLPGGMLDLPIHLH
jgi:hypothetical protein